MIPDFKTYIGESAWGDMRKRSSGETIRKEDSLNEYDFDELYNYINHNYSDLSYKPFSLSTYVNLDKQNEIIIGYHSKHGIFSNSDFMITYNMENKPRKIYVEVNDGWDNYDKIMDAIKPTKLFKTKTDPGSQDFRIFPMDGKEPDNDLFVKLVKCLINNLKN